MYCPKCGSPNEKAAKFCIKCGERLPVSGQPEAKLPAPTRPPDTQQRQGPTMPQPAVPSKRKGMSKLVLVLLVMILILLLLLAAELILMLTGWPEATSTATLTVQPAAAAGESTPTTVNLLTPWVLFPTAGEGRMAFVASAGDPWEAESSRDIHTIKADGLVCHSHCGDTV